MKKYILAFGIIILGLAGVISYYNQFDMIIEDEVIHSDGTRIAVEYAMPKKSSEKPGLLLFIHGDGPANKNLDEGYYPAWEVLSKENMISVSWDKAGIGGSTGNWLTQDMEDRKNEAELVLEWARQTFDIDPDRVGVWGASQGGWVISKLLTDNDSIKFAIGVAPAVNWLRQGEFNTISEMTYEGYSSKEIEDKRLVEADITEYLQQNDYQGYLNSGLDKKVISEDRWAFIHKNMTLDNTEELRAINKPYYLLLGDHDINVDVQETEEIYRECMDKEHLTVKHINKATHRMLKPRHQKDTLMTVLEALFNPRWLFSPDYLDSLKDIAEEI